jgi:bacillithiol system protein YtxJ
MVEQSHTSEVVLFKHSTSCVISASVKKRLEAQWEKQLGDRPIYYLDLLAYRPISNEVARRFEVTHQSPQVLVISNGKSVYHASHIAISASGIAKHIQN